MKPTPKDITASVDFLCLLTGLAGFSVVCSVFKALRNRRYERGTVWVLAACALVGLSFIGLAIYMAAWGSKLAMK